MLRRVKLLVSGRVQGVYFRMFTQKQAKHFGVNGYVRNLDDGRVEIVAEAHPELLDKMIAWAHKGPITARVDQVESSELAVDEVFVGFEVR